MRALVLLVVLLSSLEAVAERVHGGFGGPAIGTTVLHGDPALVVGGRGAWLFQGRTWLGGAMTGVVPTSATFTSSSGEERSLRLGYGGVWGGAYLYRGEVLRVGAGAIVGIGWAKAREVDEPLDWLASVEPQIEIDVDIDTASFLRVGLVLGWRWLGGVEVDGLAPSSLDGASASLLLKFGAF